METEIISLPALPLPPTLPALAPKSLEQHVR